MFFYRPFSDKGPPPPFPNWPVLQPDSHTGGGAYSLYYVRALSDVRTNIQSWRLRGVAGLKMGGEPKKNLVSVQKAWWPKTEISDRHKKDFVASDDLRSTLTSQIPLNIIELRGVSF